MSIRRFSVLATLITLSFGSIPALAESNFNPNSTVNNPLPQLIAQPPGGSGGSGDRQGGRGRRGKFMEELNLTTEQQEQIQEIREKYRPQMQQRRETLQKEQETLQQMMTGNASRDAILRQHQKVASLRQELGNLRFQSMLDTREVLTEEQRQKFAQMMEERRGQRRDRRNQGNRSGGGDRFRR
ncbi:MAG: Spy/CpxP family protein refolding chaperone [Moorea sp. SIO2B7]|nr:Spy/CpxP family protein refolding chaperone [Moorena sp. SIO2B7]